MRIRNEVAAVPLNDPTGKWTILNHGRRQADPAVAIDWESGRICLITHVHSMYGSDLEHLPTDRFGKHIAAILQAREWKRPIVVGYRVDWGPDDYFIHASKLMAGRPSIQ